MSIWLVATLFLLHYSSYHSVLGSQSQIKTYTYRSYHDIVEDLQELAASFPDYVEVYTAQERYGLPSPGHCGNDGGCQQHVLVLTQKSTLAESGGERPEVFFSGCLHGNEQVGPTTLVETARLLAAAAACADGSGGGGGGGGGAGGACAAAAAEPHRGWLAHLVRTRTIVMMPMTNSLGYFQNKREENSVDPNRDFPYDQSGASCMRSVAARAVNEVWREHLFQLALTFHGGMTAIAYEWGAPNHPGPNKDVSPDDRGQVVLSNKLSLYSGHFQGQSAYPTGRLNDLVYPVRGGMEDWGYAGSWDRHDTCAPNTFGGYPAARTTYEDATLRAFNILVETADQKKPAPATLGTDEEVFLAAGAGNGHVPRNARLVLMAADAAQPYVVWTRLPGLEPGRLWPSQTDPDQLPRATVDDGDEIHIAFEVWGAVTTDAAEVCLRKASSYDPAGGPEPVCAEQAGAAAARAAAAALSGCLAPGAGGSARWASPHLDPAAEGGGFALACAPAAAAAALAPLEPGSYVLVARVQVDQDWAQQPSKAYPSLGPQSHLVNARTNPNWDKANAAGKRVRGRAHWYSAPVLLAVPGPGGDAGGGGGAGGSGEGGEDEPGGSSSGTTEGSGDYSQASSSISSDGSTGATATTDDDSGTSTDGSSLPSQEEPASSDNAEAVVVTAVTASTSGGGSRPASQHQSDSSSAVAGGGGGGDWKQEGKQLALVRVWRGAWIAAAAAAAVLAAAGLLLLLVRRRRGVGGPRVPYLHFPAEEEEGDGGGGGGRRRRGGGGWGEQGENSTNSNVYLPRDSEEVLRGDGENEYV